MPNGLMLVVTTSDDRSVLEKIAGRLVELRLAACCQISSPITSVYRWEGRVEQSEEHNYDVPQIVGVPMEACSDAFRAWLLEAVDVG